MQKLPSPVVTYLEKLELELKQKVGVSPEEALCDAREHLCRHYQELVTAADVDDDEMVAQLIHNYGEPSEVAGEYERNAKPNRLQLPGHAPGWRICCTTCGRSAPAAKVGITRIAAASVHKYTLGWCHDCGFFRFMRIQKDLDKPTLTAKLGLTTVPAELREVSHRPWQVLASIAVLVAAMVLMSAIGLRMLNDNVQPAVEVPVPAVDASAR